MLYTIAAMSQAKNTTYADAGVSIDRGNQLVKNISQVVADTSRNGVMGNLGGFGALFDISDIGYKNPVLVSGTDGVGTKLNLAIQAGIYEYVGIDLVAMCVNDLLVLGAEPLFFLDYYATSKLDVEAASRVVTSIATGCKQAGCALIGGETAEMPGMYKEGDFDLAGFCVGVVEKEGIINGSEVSEGDAIIALASSGVHSNGYSLIRKILADSGTSLSTSLAGKTFGEILLTPTRIYVKPVLELIRQVHIKSIAHITGGGLLENIPRVIPETMCARINTDSWRLPEVFSWLQQAGNISKPEMFRTFNCGIGMVIIVEPDAAKNAVDFLNAQGESAWIAGSISGRQGNSPGVALGI